MIVNAYGKGGGSYMEPGDFLVHIFEVKDNEKTAKPAVDVIFKNDQGQIIKDTFWMNDEAIWRFANLAIACGFASGPKDEKMKRLNSNSLCGREVMIRVAKETSTKDRKDYSVVKHFWSPKAIMPAKLTEEDPGRDDKGFEAYEEEAKKLKNKVAGEFEEDPF
jgi:hypothetical protein